MTTQHIPQADEDSVASRYPHLLDSKGRYIVRIPKQSWFLERGIGTVPSYVWRNPKFLFRPVDYMLESQRLQPKIISADVQLKSLESFIDNPIAPAIYGVGAEPTDSQALYFASYLAYLYTAIKPSLHNGDEFGPLHWEYLTGGFRNRLIYDDGSINENIGLLIISNVIGESSNTKLEKLRDLLVAYSHIPRIVVTGGEDPLTFFSTKLHHKMTHLFYSSGKLARRQNEVV